MTQSTLIPYEEQRRSFLSCCYRFHEVLPGLLAMFFIAIFSNNLAGVPNPFTLQNLFHYLDNVIGPVNGQPLFQILNSNFVWNPFLVGFIIVNVFGIPDSWKRGLSYIHKLMPLGIIMLAPHFVFSHATKAGWPIIIIALVVMFVMASVTMWLGRLFKVDDRQAGDITGALVTGDPHVTAILMPMLKAKNGQVINALACVLLFGLIMSFLLPVVGNLLGMEEPVFGLLSVLGINSILLFFIKRYFDRRDQRERQEMDRRADLFKRVDTALETLRLLSYHRMSQEIERLLDQGYATPAERRVLDEMYANYKDHGWNGDMDARLEKVYGLRTDHAEK